MSKGIREKLNNSPRAVAIGTAIVLAIVALVIWRTMARPTPYSHSAFYTNDDGVTFYTAPVRPLPFQKEGKEVVRAMVFSCDHGATMFVGYLMRPAEVPSPASGVRPAPYASESAGMEVKKPGDAHWIGVPSGPPTANKDPARDAYNNVVNVKCSGGSGIPMFWNP